MATATVVSYLRATDPGRKILIVHPKNLNEVEISDLKNELFKTTAAANRKNFNFDLEPAENGYSAALTSLLNAASKYLRATGVGHVVVPSEGQIYIVPSTASPLGGLSLALFRTTGHLLHLNNENRQGFIGGKFNIPIADLLGTIKEFDAKFLQTARTQATFAQAQAKKHISTEEKKIRKAFWDRFEQQPMPKAFASNVSQSSNISRSKEQLINMMNSDFKSPTAMPSVIARKRGFKVFGHATTTENLVQIMNSGALKMAENGQGSRGIYAQLFKNDSFEPGGKYQVLIAFKMELLDRDNYYANAGWQYGAYTAYSVSPLVSRGRLEYFLQHLVAGGNEFVFQESIGTDAILSIRVPTGSKQTILRELKNKQSPDGRLWEDLIVELP